MIRKGFFLLLVTSLLILVGRTLSQEGAVTAERYVSEKNISLHPLVHYDRQLFFSGIEWAEQENNTFSSPVSGGIVPHHIVPSYMIADFFKKLSYQNPTTIILLGPNHNNLGDHTVLTSTYGWRTPFGAVYPDTQITEKLTEKNLAFIDEATLPKDHSVSTLMPFIAYYIPNAKVVPLLLSGFVTMQESQMLAAELSGFASEKVVIVAAVDFSHYLRSEEAKEKDDVTLELMKNNAYEKIYMLDNSHLDSPESITVLLMTMENLGTNKMQILHHTNSGEMQKNETIETTSYFSIGFY